MGAIEGVAYMIGGIMRVAAAAQSIDHLWSWWLIKYDHFFECKLILTCKIAREASDWLFLFCSTINVNMVQKWFLIYKPIWHCSLYYYRLYTLIDRLWIVTDGCLLGSYWASIFTMCFQIDCLHFFGDQKLKSLVSLERGDSALSYREVTKKTSRQKNFGLRVVGP